MPVAKQINPRWDWAKRFRISQGISVDNILYVSGQVAYSSDGKIVGRGDMRAQADQVFRNLREIVEMAGGLMANVVKITTYLTDMDQYGEYAAARSAAFPGTPPASTTVAISGLVDPELLVEVDAIAHLES